MLWESCDEAKVRREFWKMACESGTAKFAAAVTDICVRYLGLGKEKSPVPAKGISTQCSLFEKNIVLYDKVQEIYSICFWGMVKD